MARETIIIDGVRYYADRPRSCRGCFFWKNRKVGCTLKKENCRNQDGGTGQCVRMEA